MKELYDKVATDSLLQVKYAEIMKEAEKAGREETEKKLLAFASAAGYDLTIEGAADFFSALENKEEGELTDTELDMVAGGKTFNLPDPDKYKGGHLA